MKWTDLKDSLFKGFSVFIVILGLLFSGSCGGKEDSPPSNGPTTEPTGVPTGNGSPKHQGAPKDPWGGTPDEI